MKSVGNQSQGESLNPATGPYIAQLEAQLRQCARGSSRETRSEPEEAQLLPSPHPQQLQRPDFTSRSSGGDAAGPGDGPGGQLPWGSIGQEQRGGRGSGSSPWGGAKGEFYVWAALHGSGAGMLLPKLCLLIPNIPLAPGPPYAEKELCCP